MTGALERPPIACTLSTGDLQARLARIAQLADRHLLGQRQDGAKLHLTYAHEAAAELKDIVALERECCAFLHFDLLERGKVVELAITAPGEASEFAGMLFAHFSASAAAAPASRCTAACGCRAPGLPAAR
ncbi:MAG: hypothetical protein V4864_04250 [Pseudomonadota bacterium]